MMMNGSRNCQNFIGRNQPVSARNSAHLSIHQRGKQTQFDVALKIFLKQP